MANGEPGAVVMSDGLVFKSLSLVRDTDVLGNRDVYDVVNHKQWDLGRVEWMSMTRQFHFFPHPAVNYQAAELLDIQRAIKMLTKQRKENR